MAKLGRDQLKTTREMIQLVGFDLRRYDPAGKLDAGSWARQLMFRRCLKTVYLPACTDDESFKKTSLMLHQLFNHPVNEEQLGPLWDSAAKYQTIGDISKSDDPYRFEEGREAWIFVDLSATDDQLIEDFSKWLARRREADRKRLVETPPPSCFSEVDFKKWHDHRVLAYIDLELFAAHFDLKLTNELIGSYLFADDLEISPSEKIRKTVRPLAKRLLSSGVIQSLDRQAGQTFYACDDKRKKNTRFPFR